MIKIELVKNNDIIDKITIKGHSGYDVSGKDIVCAGVSSITITTVNAILMIDETAITYDKNDGYLQITINKHTDIIDLLIKNMISLLTELQEQYSEYVKI